MDPKLVMLDAAPFNEMRVWSPHLAIIEQSDWSIMRDCIPKQPHCYVRANPLVRRP
jgi:hypothetical protein